MNEDPADRNPPRADGTARYRIVVSGRVPESFSDRLSGMSVCTSHDLEGGVKTTLVGLIRDQSELSGVLATLQGLHLTIVGVERLGNG